MKQVSPLRGRAACVAWPCVTALLLTLAACGGEDEAKKTVAATQPPPTFDPSEPGTPIATPAFPAAPPPAPDAPAVSADHVVVTVDGTAITQGQIDKLLERMVYRGMQIPAAQLPQVRAKYGAKAEEVLVEEKLLENAAAAEKVTVTPEELEARWAELEKGWPKGLTRAQALARSRVTQEQADVEITKHLRIEKLLEKTAGVTPVTSDEVRKYYDDNQARFKRPAQARARHILVAVDRGATDEAKAEAKKKLEGIRTEITDGGKAFADLAKEHSACPSKKDGGDLGTFRPGNMVPEFDKLAFSLAPGVVSEVFETKFGFHIMKVEERTEAGVQPFEELKGTIETQLKGQRLQEARKGYVDVLRKKAKIERPEPKK